MVAEGETEGKEEVEAPEPAGGPIEFLKRNIDVVALVLILVLALLLRLRQAGHILSFDEAWNAVTVLAGAAGKTRDIFFFNFYRHPPIYLSAAILYRKLFPSSTGFMQAVSIASGLGVITTLFFVARKGVGKACAVFAAFFLAVAPVACVFDTWVKQDSLAILFATLFACFFLKRRYIVAGVFLGLGLLTKEIVLFTALGAVIYTALTFSRKKLAGLAEAFGIGIVMSAWWYFAFSNTSGDFLRFFFGNSPVNARFHEPWHYYLSGLPREFTWPGLVFLVVGVVVWAVRRARRKKGEKGTEDYVLFAILWAGSTLLILTLSVGKPVWMVYSAAAPISLVAGYGLSSMLSIKVVRKELVYAVIALVLLGGIAYGLTLKHTNYMNATGSWGDTLEDHAIAMKMNSMSGPGDNYVMSMDDLSPVTSYYLKAYAPDSITRVPLYDGNGKKLDSAAMGREKGKNIYLVDRAFPASLVTSYVEKLSPDLLMIKDLPNGSLSTKLARQLEKKAPYVKVANGRIWTSEDMTRATGSSP
jgi:4-amino-4-deoxy-L-arabinose transferase-like glycosyltransferase